MSIDTILNLDKASATRKCPESLRGDLKKWHATTRERLVCTGSNDDHHSKWGRFLPKQRFNVDQSPLSFAIDVKKTSEKKKQKKKKKKKYGLANHTQVLISVSIH